MLYVPLVTIDPFARGLSTRATSCAEPPAPALTVPMFQVTIPPVAEPPAVADTNVVLAGRLSRTTTPVAFAVPVLFQVSVYVMFAPAATGSGAPVFEMLRTGTELTVVVSSAPLTGP